MAERPEVRIDLSDEVKERIEAIRDQIKDVASDDYGYGVVDALAFVWAGMPHDAGGLYGAAMSQFAELAREAGL